MRRVSSRQRLVSWDAFDAAADSASDDENSFCTCRRWEESGSQVEHSASCSSLISLRECHSEDSPLKRKRCCSAVRCKQEPTVIPAFQSDREEEEPTVVAPTLQCDKEEPTVVPAFKWEMELTLESLNDDMQLNIFEFCDRNDVRSMMQVNHRYRNLIASSEAKALWKLVCQQQWPWLNNNTTDIVDALHLPTAVLDDSASNKHDDEEEMANLSLLLSLAAEHKPTTIDESIFSPCRWSRSLRRFRPRTGTAPELQMLQVPDTTSGTSTAAVQFTGLVGVGDRCIRADQPLPRPALLPEKKRSSNSLLQRLSRLHKHHRGRNKSNSSTNTWRPFVAPFVMSSNQVHVTPRLISYFEVSVLGKPKDVVQQQQPHFEFQAHLQQQQHPPPSSSSSPECVAIGLATEDFSLHTRMPGWDRFSFGYHGDDGGIFHGHGNMLREYGPRYGVGDTIGCGVDYQNGSVFFTLNGKLLGTAFTLSKAELQQDFYPVVGMDTHCPVACNFGCERPFRFDLNDMICQQRNVILDSL